MTRLTLLYKGFVLKALEWGSAEIDRRRLAARAVQTKQPYIKGK